MSKSDWCVLARLHGGTLKVDPITGDIFSNIVTSIRSSWRKLRGYHEKGYHILSLHYGGKRFRHVFAHRVVWMASHGEIPPRMLIHHKNHDRGDNRLANLDLVPVNTHPAEGRTPVTRWIPEFLVLSDMECPGHGPSTTPKAVKGMSSVEHEMKQSHTREEYMLALELQRQGMSYYSMNRFLEKKFGRVFGTSLLCGWCSGNHKPQVMRVAPSLSLH